MLAYVWRIHNLKDLTDLVRPAGGGRGFLGPLDFDFAQHSPTTRPLVKRTAEKAFMLSDRI